MSSDKTSSVLMLLDKLNTTYSLDGNVLTAVEEATVTILPGEYVAISGLYGAAKSAFLQCLGCLRKPSSGKYLLDYEDIGLTSDQDLIRLRNNKVGFVLKPANLIAEATVIEHITLPGKYTLSDKADKPLLIEQFLNFWGLQSIQNKPISALDALQKRKVTFAMAMVRDPLVLLMDEPIEGLDSYASIELLEKMKLLSEQGKTLVVFTNSKEVINAARRSIVFQNGRILADHSVN